MNATTVDMLRLLAAHHASESKLAERRYRAESAAWHRGLASAYANAARMIEGTDAS